MWRLIFFSFFLFISSTTSSTYASDFSSELEDFYANRIVVWFVDNTNPTPGDGSLHNPFNTLLAAELASAPGDIICVFPGDHTTNGMDTGIVLKDNQKLIGSSQFLSRQEIDPSDDPALAILHYPVITNITGFGVVLANNTVVSGIHFDSTASFAIEGFDIENVRVIKNVITSPLTFGGINLFEVTGKVEIKDNAILLGRDGLIAGISYELTGGRRSQVEMIDNVIQGYPSGLSMFIIGPTTRVLAKILRNDISGSSLSAVLIEASTESQLGLNFSSNRVHDNVESNVFNGTVQIFSSASAFIKGIFANNQISHNAEEGLTLHASLGGRIQARVFNNLFNHNLGIGFNASTDDFGGGTPSSICLSLNLNISDNGFLLTNGVGSVFYLEPPFGNRGTITKVGVITPVAAGFCD